MTEELEIAILKFMNEAQKYFPYAWGNLEVGKAYDELWKQYNHAKGMPTFAEFVGQEMPKYIEAFNEWDGN